MSDTRYKQAVTEFLVAKTESVRNNHKWLCTVYRSCAVDRSTVGRWTRFEDEGRVIHAVRTWLHEQEISWWRERKLALVSHWCNVVDVDGDYVEK